jgi:uncharacterized membrane protein YjjP (DUF1212 family)
MGPSAGPGIDRPVHPAAPTVLTLARALHACGVSAHRLEATLLAVGDRLGVELNVFSMPTGILVGFGPPEHGATALVRVQPARVDLERLSRLDAIADDLIAGRISQSAAVDLVQRLSAEPPRWGAAAQTLAHASAAAAFAVFFGGGPRELAASAAIGLITGAVSAALRPASPSGRLFELTASAAASAAAGAVSCVLGPFSHAVAVASGLILLMPGLSLTVGLNELAHRHLASGSGRLAGAAVVLLAMIFGTAVGARIGGLLPGAAASDAAPAPLPDWAVPPALIAAAAGFTVLYRGRPADAGWILLGAAVAWVGSRFGERLLGPQLGAFVAALTLGAAANLFARLLRRPAFLLLIPGLSVLVPGVAGYRSLACLLERDVFTGVDAAFSASLTAVALVAGMLFSNAVVDPRRTV